MPRHYEALLLHAVQVYTAPVNKLCGCDRGAYLRSPLGLADLLAVAPFWAELALWAAGRPLLDASAFREIMAFSCWRPSALSLSACARLFTAASFSSCSLFKSRVISRLDLLPPVPASWAARSKDSFFASRADTASLS